MSVAHSSVSNRALRLSGSISCLNRFFRPEGRFFDGVMDLDFSTVLMGVAWFAVAAASLVEYRRLMLTRATGVFCTVDASLVWPLL
jgi:hypothetical protein